MAQTLYFEPLSPAALTAYTKAKPPRSSHKAGSKECSRAMIGSLFRGCAAVCIFTLAAVLASGGGAAARTAKHKSKEEPKAETKQPPTTDTKKSGKPSQLANYGDWGVFLAQGEMSKTCYALATPKDRTPAGLKRDPAFVFISNRPGENVHEEISVIMGFPVKENAVQAEVAGSTFDLIAKGTNAWIKNPAEESQFIEALKKGAKLVVHAPSAKGHVTTDSYSLAGLSQALDRIGKECP